MSRHLTKVDVYLDDQGENQIELDCALVRIEDECRVALTAMRLAVAAEDTVDRVEYLLTALDAFKEIVNAKELARVASGQMAIAREQIRGLHLIVPTGRHAEALA